MDPLTIVLIAAIVVIAAVAAYFFMQKRQTDHLAGRFGPEYERTVHESDGGRKQAESELAEREERVSKLDIRHLSSDELRTFSRRWEEVQATFVDDPSAAIRDADGLVQEVMSARGYPVGDFEQRAADVSVDHPRVVEHYRSAHGIAERHLAGGVETEQLRRAMIDYRALFTDLLEAEDPQAAADGTADRDSMEVTR